MSSPIRARGRGLIRVWVDALRGARRNTPMRQLSSRERVFSAQYYSLRYGLMCELAREVRNLYRRIAEMHGTSEDEQGVALTWLRGASIAQQDAMYQDYREGIQSLQNQYPWLTAFDFGLFREGLKRGVSYLSRTHKEGQRSDLP